MWLNNKILVATDFGELSETICKMGLELAARFQAPLVVMHAYALPSPDYAGHPILPPAQFVRRARSSCDHAQAHF